MKGETGKKRVECPKCFADISLRKDGRLPKHKIPKMPWSSWPTDICPYSGNLLPQPPSESEK